MNKKNDISMLNVKVKKIGISYSFYVNKDKVQNINLESQLLTRFYGSKEFFILKGSLWQERYLLYVLPKRMVESNNIKIGDDLKIINYSGLSEHLKLVTVFKTDKNLMIEYGCFVHGLGEKPVWLDECMNLK